MSFNFSQGHYLPVSDDDHLQLESPSGEDGGEC